nr:MAG TPA: phosphoribitoyl transferase [Caudoviricetes sp.]DAS70792.1 MAG TPA: phosphoribitoyl transferase [Caudoviricetes sp.]
MAHLNTYLILILIRYKIRQDWLVDSTCLNSKVK